MPDFRVDDLEISPSDFVNECSDEEIIELIEILKEDGYIDDFVNQNREPLSVNELILRENILKILNNQHQLTNEDEEILKTISNKII